ncbi:MAG: helix-turn-helix transcriptional regulator [Bacteroidia bacterium]
MEADKTDEANVLFGFLLELVLGQWNAVPGGDPMAPIEGKVFQLANLFSEELRALILHKTLVNPRKRYRFVHQGLFILDEDFQIQALGSDTASFLGMPEVSLYKTDFTAYLTAWSRKAFFQAAASLRLEHPSPPPQVVRLEFVNTHGARVVGDCFLELLLYGKYPLAISLFALKPVVLNKGGDREAPDKNLAAVQQVYDFIRSHKEGALPSAHAFARQFGTNEYDLKKEFKKRFGTSIYHCYTLLRLERAHQLILATRTPLSVVAQQCGFEDYSGFARAYRKQYGRSPAMSREQE